MPAKLFFYKMDDRVGRRQYPISAGENLMMLMDMNSKGLVIDCPMIRGKELEEFTRKFNLLTNDELRESLEIDSTTFMSVMNQCVQCVGCRRRVERLFHQLSSTGYPTLDPLCLRNSPPIITNNNITNNNNNNTTNTAEIEPEKVNILTIVDDKLRTPQSLGTLLYRHHEVLNNLLDNKLRNKTRCLLHSLDSFRSKPFSETWREVWTAMKNTCRDELVVIETKELHEVLENYLKKHKFCQGCRTKIEKAYKLLTGELATKEKGYVPALFSNIKKCHPDKHIHVLTNKIDFLDALVRRAEPEVNGSYIKQRERHAKTLEIAQEEVLTCVGIIMYERLRCVYVNLREEERACQVLAAVGVHALCRNFDMSVEKKQGISNLELLYKEISRAEKAKELKREQKKLKKKKKKFEKKNIYLHGSSSCEIIKLIATEEDDDEYIDVEALDLDDDDDDVDDDDDQDHDHGHNHDDYDEVANEEVASSTDSESCHNVVITSPLSVVGNVTAAPKTKKKKKQKHRKSKATSQQQQQQQQQQKKNNKKNAQGGAGGRVGDGAIVSSTSHSSICSANNDIVQQKATAITTTTTTISPTKCTDCLAIASVCPCDSDVKDSGYGSEANSIENSHISSEISSPDGSEISCSDGFCNHDNEHGNEHSSGSHCLDGSSSEEHLLEQHCENEICDSMLCPKQHIHNLSLQQMLDDFNDSDEDYENCYIPQEVVLEYQCQHEKVQQQRLQLRETLRQNFARLCQQRGLLATLNCK